MNKTVIPLSLLKKGDKAIIVSFDNSALGIKLMEMECSDKELAASFYVEVARIVLPV